ncbi:hypothetical protein HYW19_03900 [Candidatus Woesearchaeota archaeon]|nr:hypothetical protein [Candidatus Woesearchaeota archaeon]
MTIIADATSLILLSKASILETFANRNDIVMPELVYAKVIKGKEKGRIDSILTERLVQEGKIKVKIPNENTKTSIEKLFNLKFGELEVISLAHNTNNTILSDDKKCINAAKALGIKFITLLDIIIALYRKNAITKGKTIESIDKLENYGWYSKGLIEIYRGKIK